MSGAVSERRHCWNSTEECGTWGVEAVSQCCWRTERTSSEVCNSTQTQRDIDRERQICTHTHLHIIIIIIFV